MRLFNKDIRHIVPIRFVDDTKYLEPLKEMYAKSVSDVTNWNSIKEFITVLNDAVVISKETPVTTIASKPKLFGKKEK